MRAATHRRHESELVIKHARNTLDDGKSKPEAAGHPGAAVEAMKLLEDGLLVCCRDAKAGVVDIDAQGSAPAAAPFFVVGGVLSGGRWRSMLPTET